MIPLAPLDSVQQEKLAQLQDKRASRDEHATTSQLHQLQQQLQHQQQAGTQQANLTKQAPVGAALGGLGGRRKKYRRKPECARLGRCRRARRCVLRRAGC